MAGLFDWLGQSGTQNLFGLGSWGGLPAQPAAQSAAAPPGTATGTPAYSPEMIANSRYQLLAQMGMGLMAAGQPMSGAQRSQYLAQLGQLPADYQKSLAQQLEMAQKQQEYQRQQQAQAYLSNMSPDQLQKLGFTPEQATLFKGMGAPADIIEKQAFPGLSGSSQNLGMELRYWKTADGKLHAGQLMPGGGVKEVALPAGAEWAPQTQYLDVGTGYQAAPKIGAQPGQVIPKDVAGEAAQKETGKSQAEVKQLLPAAEAATNDATALIDNLLADQNGMQWAVGASSGYGALIPGTPGYDYAARVDNLKGKVFLQAYQQLRGAGAITEQEGQAATAAIANLDRAQSEPQFQMALTQLRDILQRGYQNLRIKAGQGAPAPSGNGGGAGQTLTYNPQTGKLE
jgi:hypothetical protein